MPVFRSDMHQKIVVLVSSSTLHICCLQYNFNRMAALCIFQEFNMNREFILPSKLLWKMIILAYK